jgi:phosphohistidine phosphatase SixA
MIKMLVECGMGPEVIATSPMTRCVQTAEVLAAGVPGGAKIVARDELLPGGSFEDLLAWTAKESRRLQQIAWVGHAPDVSRLAAAMLGQTDDCIRFGKGAVAAIRLPGMPQAKGGELRWLVTAKVLGC